MFARAVQTVEETMGTGAVVIWLVIGAIAGWLARTLVKGGGLGLIGDIIVGMIGGVICGLVVPPLGIETGDGFFLAIIDAIIGAVILLVIVRLGKGSWAKGHEQPFPVLRLKAGKGGDAQGRDPRLRRSSIARTRPLEP